MVNKSLLPVVLGLFLAAWINSNEGFVAEQVPVPESENSSSSRCERFVEEGMAVYLSPLLEDSFRLDDIWSEHEIADKLCAITDARTIDDLMAALDLESILPAWQLPEIPLFYVAGTAIFDRYIGGIDLVEERIQFVEAFADFAHETHLGDIPIPYEAAHHFTSNWVAEFGEDFLRKMDFYPLSDELPFSPDDVINPETLARALTEVYINPSPVTFAETSGLSRDTSMSILKGIRMLQYERAELHILGEVKRLATDAITFLRTADEFGLLDLRASYD